MRRAFLTVVVTGAAGVAMVAPVTAAQADSRLSGPDLTRVVTSVTDLQAFYPKARTERGPVVGRGSDRIATQGICMRAGGTASLRGLPKRQAWADYRVGASSDSGQASLSLIGQYNSVARAKAKFRKVRTLLRSCPHTVTVDGVSYVQSWSSQARIYRGRAAAVLTRVEDSNGQHAVQYAVVRQVGASLSFARFAETYETTLPDPTQMSGAMQTMSALMGYRYHNAS